MGLDNALLLDLHTSQGICQCVIKPYMGMYEADMWRSGSFKGQPYTLFSACVCLQWNGQRYEIVRRKPADHSNEYWLELEELISNIIIVNT